jgi:hypothetical protein
MKNEAILRTCVKGYKFCKSSDCPSCPVYETGNEPETGLLALVRSPFRGALVHEGISTLEKLAAQP